VQQTQTAGGRHLTVTIRPLLPRLERMPNIDPATPLALTTRILQSSIFEQSQNKPSAYL